MVRSNASSARKRINLALQGGGAHGAFTWGVLDALLEDDRVEVAAISGASAGAMNAVALLDGWRRGGREEARACLRRFWEAVADKAHGAWSAWSPVNAFLASTPGFITAWGPHWFESWARMVSPYDVNPLNWNPLRDLIGELVDFDAVRACSDIDVFVAATNVETGRTRVFRRDELTADHVMASACLPTLFQAVEIDGEPYWDGGFVGNPPLYPFFYESDSRDILVVQINPIARRGTPKTAHEILDRMREITFNSSLLREYRNIEFVARLVEQERVDPERYRAMLIHRIDGGRQLAEYGASTRMVAEKAFFEALFERGREAAQNWLASAWKDVGERSTLDVRNVLDDPDADA